MTHLRLLLASAVLAWSGVVAAQGYTLNVVYDRAGLLVPHWEMTIGPTGAGTYTGKVDKVPDPGPLQFAISAAGREKLRAALEKSHGLKPCETKTKGVANMGGKTITYTPATGPAQTCTFNYTENKGLAEAIDYVFAMVNTLQAGAELERLRRFSKLAMDPVMVRLADDAKGGHAVEMGAIRPTLQGLIDDPGVLERVRSRAQDLLATAEPAAK